MSTADADGPGRPGRPGRPDRPARTRGPRREKGARESLLSIVLVLEAISLFFAILVVFGRQLLPTPVAWTGGLVAIVLVLLVSRVQRHPWGIALGAVVQVGLLALGLLDGVMVVVGLLFAAIWTWALIKGGQLDRTNAARRRAAGDAPGPTGAS